MKPSEARLIHRLGFGREDELTDAELAIFSDACVHCGKEVTWGCIYPAKPPEGP